MDVVMVSDFSTCPPLFCQKMHDKAGQGNLMYSKINNELQVEQERENSLEVN